jgi:hypothetical protein
MPHKCESDTYSAATVQSGRSRSRISIETSREEVADSSNDTPNKVTTNHIVVVIATKVEIFHLKP